MTWRSRIRRAHRRIADALARVLQQRDDADRSSDFLSPEQLQVVLNQIRQMPEGDDAKSMTMSWERRLCPEAVLMEESLDGSPVLSVATYDGRSALGVVIKQRTSGNFRVRLVKHNEDTWIVVVCRREALGAVLLCYYQEAATRSARFYEVATGIDLSDAMDPDACCPW